MGVTGGRCSGSSLSAAVLTSPSFAWTGSMDEFTEFAEQINGIHGTIKFTYEVSKTEVVFLDLVLYKGQRFAETGILDVRTHIKPTNK